MKNNRHDKGLLENISALAGCIYLSDLHCYPSRYNVSILKAVRQMKEHSYSLKEWTDTVCYITGSTGDFKSVEEAVSFLEKYLNG